MKPVLILGGYGGFGSRLARRLAADGIPVLVAGRNLAKAEAFARTLVGDAKGVAIDRTADLRSALQQLGPALVIDTAGPFQDAPLSLVRQAIDCGISYLDIADDRQFVLRIRELDGAAKAHGVVAISGASSVPALSGAVVRKLAEELDDVRWCEIAISASSRAAAGPSVSQAILAGAGQAYLGWDGGRPRRMFGWGGLRFVRFDLAGGGLGARLVSDVEVPDLSLLPKAYPGLSHVRFLAGTESLVANAGLWLLSLPVRLRMVRSLLPLAPVLNWAQRLTALWGGDRSGMLVRLVGHRGMIAVERKWTLVADQGDGPEIPLLAAQLLARRILKGEVEAGARPAFGELTLGQFEPLFADLHVRHEVEEVELPPPLYQRVLGSAFATLPPVLRRMHDPGRQAFAIGRADVLRGRGVLAHVAATLVGMPPEGEHALHVTMDARGGGERWTRDFGGHRFASHLSCDRGRLVERFGALRFHFDLPIRAGRLSMVIRGWSIFGLPMPLALAPRIEATEWAEDDRFNLEVKVSLPLAGLVVRYRGWLVQPGDWRS